jgi:hypothetical protein
VDHNCAIQRADGAVRVHMDDNDISRRRPGHDISRRRPGHDISRRRPGHDGPPRPDRTVLL